MFRRIVEANADLRVLDRTLREQGFALSHVTLEAGDTLATAHYTFPPECCQECGRPFNNADPTPSGRCAECDA